MRTGIGAGCWWCVAAGTGRKAVSCRHAVSCGLQHVALLPPHLRRTFFCRSCYAGALQVNSFPQATACVCVVVGSVKSCCLAAGSSVRSGGTVYGSCVHAGSKPVTLHKMLHHMLHNCGLHLGVAHSNRDCSPNRLNKNLPMHFQGADRVLDVFVSTQTQLFQCCPSCTPQCGCQAPTTTDAWHLIVVKQPQAPCLICMMQCLHCFASLPHTHSLT